MISISKPQTACSVFQKLDVTVDPLPLQKALKRNSHLFGEITWRADSPGSPHRDMTDVWIRYNDIRPYYASGDFTTFNCEHESVWYPSYYKLPEAKKIIFDVMTAVNGERLGGIFITKLPPGGKIYPHKDAGWHARKYEKYYVPIENYKGSVFAFEEGVIEPDMGDVYWFNNSNWHWVNNDTLHDRIAMIICIEGER